ncbi:Protein CBG24823 [Caenorhabditis briggsae]|uniref:Protein CBG24823 n=1 Tax=Caenorhabditis briggsae TaxID=6238 RepID=A8WLK5_CAEBR|nr:Protein CBG24823 [Caenorhabditis briggsae]CAP21350.1 Protein CBG24823 [Caenorhabditis briggsae]
MARTDKLKTEAMKQSDDINFRKEDNRIERLKQLAENEDQTSAEESNRCDASSQWARIGKAKGAAKDSETA